ncbi:ABC transporter substrate-binding protein [Microaerobacter geothermalis]|uniref:ABC transporter substrate-binding protein n=1 Tax=Microaerobacter geothermalis TaxID=674972 RepID=UPI0038B28C3F
MAKWSLLGLLTLLFVGLLAGCGSSSTSGGEKVVKIGGIFDITGATADVGKPYAEGAKAYVEYINSKGGINGAKIQLIDIDYAYKPPQAVEAYKKLVQQDKVVAILGWGTGDTEALKESIAKDKIPYISGSYSENLTDIAKAPYNFLGAATYSDQARSALKWIKDNWKGSGNPKVALIYNDTPFGKSPVEDAKAFAKDIGVDIVDEEVVDLKALDATSQLLNMDKAKPDYAIIQETWGATATILKDAKKLGIKTKFIGLNWAAGEGLITLAGDAAEGFIGVIPHAFVHETDLPGMKAIEEYLSSKGQKLADKNQKFVQGWVSAQIMLEGVRNAGDKVTGETVRQGLEKLNNLDLGGLAAPVTYTPDNHRGTNKIRLAEVKNGRFEIFTDYIGY